MKLPPRARRRGSISRTANRGHQPKSLMREALDFERLRNASVESVFVEAHNVKARFSRMRSSRVGRVETGTSQSDARETIDTRRDESAAF